MLKSAIEKSVRLAVHRCNRTTRLLSEFVVKHEDSHIIVALKPSGFLSQPNDTSSRQSIVDSLKAIIRNRDKSNGDQYLSPAHRIDFPCSGLMLFAKTANVASRLSKQFSERKVVKQYISIVEGELLGEKLIEGLITIGTEKPKKKHASLRYKFLSHVSLKNSSRIVNCSFLHVDLLTGRKHQIRAQLSQLGHPILGDKKYGSSHYFGDSTIALHAYKISFRHPVNNTSMSFQHNFPEDWVDRFDDDNSDTLRLEMSKLLS